MASSYAVLDPAHNFSAGCVLVHHRAVTQMRQWASSIAILDHHELALVLLHECVEHILGTAVTALDAGALNDDALAVAVDNLGQGELSDIGVCTVHDDACGDGAADTAHPETLVVGSPVLGVHTAHSLGHQCLE